MPNYTAIVDGAMPDTQANVANIAVEFFKDGVSIGQITFRTNDPTTLPTLVANQIKAFQLNDTLTSYIANPTLGPIAPAIQPPPTQDELNAQALQQAVFNLANLKNYATLGLLAPDDQSITDATTVATTALQTVLSSKQPLPPISPPLT